MPNMMCVVGGLACGEEYAEVPERGVVGVVVLPEVAGEQTRQGRQRVEDEDEHGVPVVVQRTAQQQQQHPDRREERQPNQRPHTRHADEVL